MNPLNETQHRALLAIYEHPDGASIFPTLQHQGIKSSTVRALVRRGLATSERGLVTLTDAGRGMVLGVDLEGDL